MNIAFLFNSDHEIYNGFYGYPILELVLKQNILQKSNRNMKISVGDILTFSVISRNGAFSYQKFYELNKKVYTSLKFNHLIQPKLENISQKATIYCIFIQNINEELSYKLHKSLKNDDSYLGAMDVDLSNKYHFYFFKYCLILSYRVHSKNSYIFYNMSDNEDPDISIQECFKKNNFNVFYEDLGAINTIFDEFDSFEHFTRIQNIKNIFINFRNLNDEILDDLIIALEELHPKLFDSFHSLARTYNLIETEEDIAQCSLSGRRILEQLADYLFPAREELFNGRKVGKNQYKNRLWAYIETVAKQECIKDENMKIIGKRVDDLIELFNSGLHSNLREEQLNESITRLVFLIIEIINISPKNAKKVYLAYEKNIENFLEDVKKSYL